MSDLFAKVEALRASSAARADENRRRMPTVAAWVDEAKEVFGADQVTVAYASEGGLTMGRKMEGGVVYVRGR